MSWEKLNFMDCIQKTSYSYKIAKKEFKKNGPFPIVSQEKKLINGFWDNSSDLFKCEDKGVVIFGDHTKTLKYINFDFVIGADGVKILKPIEKLDPKFFYYQLRGIQIPDLGYARHFRLLKEYDLIIPPLSEQKQIVETLDKAFEKIDKAIANMKQNLQNTKELFESYLQNVFENKGDDWEEKPIKDLTKIVTKGSSPKWQGVNYVDEGGIFFLTSKNVGEGELLLKNKKYLEEKFNEIQKKTIHKKGDVLTNIVGASIGRTAIFNLDEITNINQAVCLMRCNSEQVYNYYLMYLLNSPFFKSILHDNEVDNARANLSLTFLKNLVIPLPKFEVQKEIVFRLKSFLGETKKLKAIYTQKIADLEELKKTILEKAFKGELTSAA